MTHSNPLTHHAYYTIGSPVGVVPILVSHIEKVWSVTSQGNPDFRIERYGAMGVGEARALKEMAERTAVTNGKKVFVVSVDSMTREAQNALLKIVEEPSSGTHFFFVLGSEEILITTLRSRLERLLFDEVFLGNESEDESGLRARTFVHSSVPIRLKAVSSFIKEVGDEDAGKGKLYDFLDALERELADDVGINAEALQEVLHVKRYSRDRAPSFKLLLEHLSLVVPIQK